jgi:peptidoglycan/xylan/chitin deacetylase (PgdA/CDA1 family)
LAEQPIAASRWLMKKTARMGVAAMTALPALAGPAWDRAPRVRVLTYHRFGPAKRAPFTVSAEDFERQMSLLAKTGKAISLDELRAHVAGERRVADGSVLVTTDDGDPSVLGVAAPILKRHGIPSVAFVLGGRPAGFDLMSDAELRALPQFGIEAASHSVSHRSMARLPPAEARREARESRARLEDVMGRPVTAFAFPFGTRADYSPEVCGILAEEGYDLAFTSQHGAARPGSEPMMLPRVKVESGDPAWLFPLLCRGAMDAWRLVDVGLQGLQRPVAAA